MKSATEQSSTLVARDSTASSRGSRTAFATNVFPRSTSVSGMLNAAVTTVFGTAFASKPPSELPNLADDFSLT